MDSVMKGKMDEGGWTVPSSEVLVLASLLFGRHNVPKFPWALEFVRT